MNVRVPTSASGDGHMAPLGDTALWETRQLPGEEGAVARPRSEVTDSSQGKASSPGARNSEETEAGRPQPGRVAASDFRLGALVLVLVPSWHRVLWLWVWEGRQTEADRGWASPCWQDPLAGGGGRSVWPREQMTHRQLPGAPRSSSEAPRTQHSGGSEIRLV